MLTHGLTRNGQKHPIYKIRERMIYYCHNVPERQKRIYSRYRGRGIRVCDEWRNDVMSFYDWCINNGWRKGKALDRINNDGNYAPSNCQFLSIKDHCIKSNRYDTPRKGTQIGTSKLTDDKVIKIKLLLKEGKFHRAIAKMFNVGKTTISYIAIGKTWKHIKVGV